VVFALAGSVGACAGTARTRVVAGGGEVVGALLEQVGGLLVSQMRGFLGPILTPVRRPRCLL